MRAHYPAALLTLALLLGLAWFATPTLAAPNAKVEVCHVPPDDPVSFHTITISEKALSAHLAHGDPHGSCNALCADVCNDEDACTVDDTGAGVLSWI